MIFLGLIFTALVLFFDGDIGYGIINQLRAESFATAAGRVTYSEVTSKHEGDCTWYDADIHYSYEVNQRTYEGTRFRYGKDLPSDGSWAYQAVKEHAVGSETAVFYNSRNPSESLLSTGLDESQFMWLLFITPFNMALLIFSRAGVTALLAKIRDNPIADLKIIQEGPRTQIRLPRWPAAFYGLGTTGMVGIVEIFLAALAPKVGFHQKALLARLALVLAYGAGFLVLLWKWWKTRSGAVDLIIDVRTRTVQLPQTFARKERALVAFSEIADITVKTIIPEESDGRPLYIYSPILQIKGKDADAGKLAEWTNQAKAEALAALVRSQLHFDADASYRPLSETTSAGDSSK